MLLLVLSGISVSSGVPRDFSTSGFLTLILPKVSGFLHFLGYLTVPVNVVISLGERKLGSQKWHLLGISPLSVLSVGFHHFWYFLGFLWENVSEDARYCQNCPISQKVPVYTLSENPLGECK